SQGHSLSMYVCVCTHWTPNNPELSAAWRNFASSCPQWCCSRRIVFDLRCACQCWQKDNEQVKLAFDNLVEWISALEGLQDPTDQLIDFGKSLLNTFRMQLTMASDPGIRLSKLRARLYTAVHQTDAYARAAQLFADREETQRTLRCQQCHIFGHEASTCNMRPRGNYSQYRRPSKNGRGAAARRS
ncbi:structural maintenance of chromosome protein 4, partial [Trypanosoma cruzi]